MEKCNCEKIAPEIDIKLTETSSTLSPVKNLRVERKSSMISFLYFACLRYLPHTPSVVSHACLGQKLVGQSVIRSGFPYGDISDRGRGDPLIPRLFMNAVMHFLVKLSLAEIYSHSVVKW